MLTVGIFSKRLSTFFVKLAAKILKKLKIKDYEKKEEKMFHALDKYNGSAKYIRENKEIILKQFICAIFQQISFYSVPVFVLHALELPKQPYIKIVGLQSIVFGTTSGIPSPGAVGVSEGAFVSIFKPIFTEEYINGAMILHRGISFYFPVIICAIVTIYSILKNKKTSLKEES